METTNFMAQMKPRVNIDYFEGHRKVKGRRPCTEFHFCRWMDGS